MAWQPKKNVGSSRSTAKAPPKPKGKDKPKKNPMSRITGQPTSDETTKRADEFPNISTFDAPDMKLALALITTDLEYKEQEELIDQARKEGKAKLHEIAVKYGTDGMRWGQYAVYDRGVVARPSCKLEDFILELAGAGVDADVIADCRKAATRDGKEFLDLKVMDLTPKTS